MIYVNNIIQSEGRILLLKRSPLDELQGWCLPGGHKDRTDKGNIEALVRETNEEINLPPIYYYVSSVHKVKIFKNEIYYFTSKLKSSWQNTVITLDMGEHCQYKWVTPAEWMRMELILDLKSHLIDILPINPCAII